jgi:hypothetical protein
LNSRGQQCHDVHTFQDGTLGVGWRDGEEPVSGRAQPLERGARVDAAGVPVGSDFDAEDRPEALDRASGADQGLRLVPFDVDLDQVQPCEAERRGDRVERDDLDVDAGLHQLAGLVQSGFGAVATLGHEQSPDFRGRAAREVVTDDPARPVEITMPKELAIRARIRLERVHDGPSLVRRVPPRIRRQRAGVATKRSGARAIDGADDPLEGRPLEGSVKERLQFATSHADRLPAIQQNR